MAMADRNGIWDTLKSRLIAAQVDAAKVSIHNADFLLPKDQEDLDPHQTDLWNRLLRNPGHPMVSNRMLMAVQLADRNAGNINS